MQFVVVWSFARLSTKSFDRRQSTMLWCQKVLSIVMGTMTPIVDSVVDEDVEARFVV